ncbi:unnamed protein product [Alopecurus aequalis]
MTTAHLHSRCRPWRSLCRRRHRTNLPPDSTKPSRARQNRTSCPFKTPEILRPLRPDRQAERDMEAETFESAGDAAAFVLSRLPHPDTAATDRAAFVDAVTSRALSFGALRRSALSLASALRLGLGLCPGDAVLLLLSPDDDPLLIPPIVLGVLAAGCVVVTAHPDATPAEIAASAHASGAAIVVAGQEMAKKIAGVVAAPLLVMSRSPDPRALSAEELMDGGDPEAALDALDADRPGQWDAALVVYSSAAKNLAMTHADLVTAAASASSPDEGRVCLASLPAWGVGVHGGLALLSLALPVAGVTTVLLAPSTDLRDAVATHGATDLVVTSEAAATLAAPTAPQGKLATLRRVTVVAHAPLAEDARQALRRRLPWVELTEMSDAPEMGTETASEQRVQMAPAELGALLLGQPEAASPLAIQHKGKMADETLARSLVGPLQKIQKTVFGDILAKSIAGKILRRHPVACEKQAVSKL